MIPKSQKLLRCELESLRCQLQAQTKAFEFLNHPVTMLEKESCLQQIKIQQLEEVLGPTSHQADKERHKWDVEEGQQELYEALAKGLQGLQKTLHDEEVQRACTTRCLQLLAQEIRDRPSPREAGVAGPHPPLRPGLLSLLDRDPRSREAGGPRFQGKQRHR
ncbi:coiled-coil domain-containing protein 159-like [Physeter macrocephalus]|uniref:Coiled-coil domain-containing protein 159-like n=1 Tax=Physeter macrocephalus TaxID=9755 RepID=A0A2Y9SQE3_PHYMC|nr:coiled-coil domain-containing protein 159-like [Physeter catodon]|eukprot:XP_023978605.1 coiled-coil domain-containing protein 159-like [Physeter catodon]